METIINGRYKIIRSIGKGSFGDVYQGEDTTTGKTVAIKREQDSKRYILKHEYEIYQDILRKTDRMAIPEIYWFGTTPNGHAMVMQRLGNSIEHYHQKCGGRFRLKTVLMLGVQMFDQIKRLHDTGYVHRDIKPHNFLFGLEDPDRVYLIDLGLAKRYKNDQSVHIRLSRGKNLVGTARYASIASHVGDELSRKDDLESLFYLLVYLAKGILPWQGITAPSQTEKYKMIGKRKQEMTGEELILDLPTCLSEFYNTVRKMEFKQRPDYKRLRSILTDLFKELDYTYDCKWDWTELKTGK